MPGSQESVTFRSAMGTGIRNLRALFVSPAGSEISAVLVIMVLVGLVTCPLALFADAPVSADGKAPVNPCAARTAANAGLTVPAQVQVTSATGSEGSLDVYTGRKDNAVQHVSAPLPTENGALAPGECLGTVVSDLARPDGRVIPASQVTSWAMSGNTGLTVFIYIVVSPRYGSVTPAGGYTGTVSLSDDRAAGGNVPVSVHVEYPRLWRAAMACVAAAWCGFFWAWLIHLTRADAPASGRFWLYIVLQLAVLTIVSFPVLDAQILTNPDWSGDLSQYIDLASLAGGSAMATTPTLRALVDRAAALMPGSSAGPADGTTAAGGDAAATAETRPVPAGSLASPTAANVILGGSAPPAGESVN